MICPSCKSSLPDSFEKCPFCGEVLKQPEAEAPSHVGAGSQENSGSQENTQAEGGAGVSEEKEVISPIEETGLVGKFYKLKSSPGMHPGTFYSSVTYMVTIGKRVLLIETRPKKFAFGSSLVLEYISYVKVKPKFASQYVLAAIIAILIAVLSPYWWFIFFAPLMLIRSYNRAVVIQTSYSKMPAVLYVANRKKALEFANDMQKIVDFNKAKAEERKAAQFASGDADEDADEGEEVDSAEEVDE